jgi:hypothetical protein
LSNFGKKQGWTSYNLYPRTTGDVNGDGKADVIGFGPKGVRFPFDGTSLGAASLWLSDLVHRRRWTEQNIEPRFWPT